MVELPALEALAYNELKDVHVSFSEPWDTLLPWKEGEFAFITVTLTNLTRCKLDRIYTRVTASGAARIRPCLYDGVYLLDGEDYWGDLECGESDQRWIRLYAHASGPVKLKVWISAEVEPYADRYRGGRTFTVIPR